MPKMFDRRSRPFKLSPAAKPAPGTTADRMEPAPGRLLALWLGKNAQLGRSWVGQTGHCSDFELRGRVETLLEALRLQKHAMNESGPAASTAELEMGMIAAGMKARLAEARQLEQALKNRASRRSANEPADGKGWIAAKMTSGLALRETSLCLQPTQELLQRLSDLRTAVTSYASARDQAHRQRGAHPREDPKMHTLVTRCTQQADAIAAILRKRGVDVH